MISLQDFYGKYVTETTDKIATYEEYLQKFFEIYDQMSVFLDHPYDGEIAVEFEFDPKPITDILKNQTMVLQGQTDEITGQAKGYCARFREYDSGETPAFSEYKFGYDMSGDDDYFEVMYVQVRYDPEAQVNKTYTKFFGWGPDPEMYDPGYIISHIAQTVGVTSVINAACNLASKGQLTLDNFNAAISSFASSAAEDTKAAIIAIRQTLAETAEGDYNSALVECLSRIWGGWKGATVDTDDDNVIIFSSTDFKVDTSLALPVSTLIQIGSSVLSLAVSLINPVLGAAAYGVYTLVSNVVQVLDRNDADMFDIIPFRNRNHNGYCIPIAQRTVSFEAVESVSTWLYNNLLNYGSIKVINGLYVAYIWYDTHGVSEQNVNIELYMDADAYYNHVSRDVNDALYVEVGDAVTRTQKWSGSIEYYDLDMILSKTSVNINQATAFDIGPDRAGNFFPIEDEVKDSSGHAAFYKILRREVSSFGALILKILYGCNHVTQEHLNVSVWNRNNPISGNDYQWFAYDPSMHVDSNGDPTAGTALAYMVACLSDCGLFQHVTFSDLTEQELKNAEANIVNSLYPCVRRILNGEFDENATIYISDESFIDMFFNFHNIDEVSTLDPEYDNILNARTSYMQCFPHVVAETQGKVFPPKSKYSIWTKVAVAIAAAATVAITAIFLKVKVKKFLNYKAAQKRLEIQALKEKADQTGNYGDWLAAYKANRKYNRFLGKITGTSYDMNNGWIEYNSGVDVVTNSVPESLASFSQQPIFDDQGQLILPWSAQYQKDVTEETVEGATDDINDRFDDITRLIKG